MELDEFTLAYIECALWSSTGENDEPLDRDYGREDVDEESIMEMARECKLFQEAWGDRIDASPRVSGQCSNREMAGHDFWLTRNGHGSGFWDGDWPEELGKQMTEASHKFGECYLYVGDDGKVYMD